MKLEEIVSKDNIKYNENMKKYNTMKVGGNADIVVFPEDVNQLINVVKYAKENNIKVTILGNGSNILVSDNGVEGIVIIEKKINNIELLEDGIVRAEAGVGMPRLAIFAKENNLSGFEFACGIPGCVAGGIKMNAGAYGSEFANVLVSCKYLDENLNVCSINKEDMKLGYRESIFIEHPEYVILEGTFKFEKKDKEEIEAKMKENTLARREKQPLEYPSAGSTFRRPVGYFVGKLITDAGLKGKMIGGACVSEKHAGFVINKTGTATCKDILDLVKYIQNEIKEKFDVELKMEIEFIGRKMN